MKRPYKLVRSGERTTGRCQITNSTSLFHVLVNLRLSVSDIVCPSICSLIDKLLYPSNGSQGIIKNYTLGKL